MTPSTVPPMPTEKFLRPVDLQVDPTVQRRFDPNHARRIATAFDPRMVGNLTVSHRVDGGFYVIDGQHRRAALIEAGKGEDEARCEVYEGLTLDQEAAVFVMKNLLGRKPNPVDTFRIRVLAGIDEALAINDVITDAGLRVEFGSQAGTVSAVGAVEWVYRLDGARLLRDVLGVIGEAWGKDRDAYDGVMVKGMGYLLHRKGGDIQREAISKRLAKEGPARELIGQARGRGRILRIQHHVAMAEELLAVYNRGRSSGRLEL